MIYKAWLEQNGENEEGCLPCTKTLSLEIWKKKKKKGVCLSDKAVNLAY